MTLPADRIQAHAMSAAFKIAEDFDHGWPQSPQIKSATPIIATAITAALDEAQRWMPIESAPTDTDLVVCWFEDGDWYEQHDRFEDGEWVMHAAEYEHYLAVGSQLGPGPSEKAPYKFWMRRPDFPLPPMPEQEG